MRATRSNPILLLITLLSLGAGSARAQVVRPITDLKSGGISDALFDVSVSDDGQWVAFLSRGDHTGQNHDRSAEVFVANRDGTGMTQLTSDAAPVAGQALLVAMAGNGTKIAFVSTSDLTGGNPSHFQQIFLVNRDGTGLAQVTTLGDNEIERMSIDDAAGKIAFSSDGDPLGTNADGNYELFAINANGTGLRQLTITTSTDEYQRPAAWVAVSGDGTKIAFESTANLVGTNPDLQAEVFVIDWAGTNLRQLTNSTQIGGLPVDSRYPAITDDAQWVYFTSAQSATGLNIDSGSEIWKVKTDGTGRALVTNSTTPTYGYDLVVSGSGNRLAFQDGDSELKVIDTTGLNLRVLTVTDQFHSDIADISGDGSRIVFTSTGNLTGANADRSLELFRVQADGSGLTQIMNNVAAFHPSVTGTGTVIAFGSNGNPTGGNPSGNEELFKINADGTGIQQLTANTGGFSQGAVISRSGNVVVFHSTANLTGQNADLSAEIFKMNPDGTGKLQLTNGTLNQYYSYFARVDDSGTWVTFSGNAALAGGNTDHHFEIWRVKTDGTGLQQITNSATADSFYPDISGDGTKVTFTSNGNFTGSNADGSFETFLWISTSGTIQQLTAGDEDSLYGRISGDGSYVYFVSDASLLEPHLRGGYEFYRVATATGVVERVEGLGFGLGYGAGNYFSYGNLPAVDDTGNRLVYAHIGDFNGANPDLNREVFLYDRTLTPGIRVGGGPAPTRISWDVESGPVRYDVVRGDVANLHIVASTVDLGPVLCVEDDSPDADTAGSDDPLTPSLGQTFFYLYRGTHGTAAGPGSYGKSTSGAERVAGAGNCGP